MLTDAKQCVSDNAGEANSALSRSQTEHSKDCRRPFEVLNMKRVVATAAASAETTNKKQSVDPFIAIAI